MNKSSSSTPLNPAVSGILALIVPGLGHICTGAVRKGLLIFGSLASIGGLLLWRIHLLAHREIGWAMKFGKALSRRPFFIGLMVVCAAAIWIWNAVDAYSLSKQTKQARNKSNGSNLIFVLILVQFFSIGWQIADIDVIKMIRKFPDAIPPLVKILWPWDAAIHREKLEITAGAEILVDDTINPPGAPVKEEGKPYVSVSPRFGNLAKMDSQGNIVEGSPITLSGSGFSPNEKVQIYWNDSVGNSFRPRIGGNYAEAVTDGAGNFEYKMTMPYRLIPPSAEGQQIHIVEARQITGHAPARPSEPLLLTIKLIIETIFMGMMATFFGILFSIPISFLAARNLMFGSPVSKAIYYITRTVLNIIRSIEPLIWALIAVVWVGLGPFAGIIALTIHSIAALGKLYSEAIENIDAGQIEAVQATGATKLQTIIHAVIPQMIPPFVSFTIYRWDINVRMSTVIGMVGGGGIGFILVQYIRLLDYKSAGIAVWFIAVTVSILDYVSAEIRNKFV